MGVHFDSRDAAIAHLHFQHFVPMTRKGHEHIWKCLTPGYEKVRATIRPIEASEVVILTAWEV